MQKIKILKQDGQTGAVKPGEDGITAIISVSSAGTANQAAGYNDPATVHTDFDEGPLEALAEYVLEETGNPVILVKGTGTTAGVLTVGALVGTGTSVPSADGSVHPYDDYPAIEIDITLGGTVGTGPIKYTYTLDGVEVSAEQSLGTDDFIVIPKSGVKIDLAAGNLVTGDKITATAVGPKLTTGDLDAALEALRLSSHPWEWLIVDRIDATAGVVGTLDAWFKAREAEGIFRGYSINSAAKGSSSEASYNTTLTGIFASAASIRGLVAADVGDCTSTRTGLTIPRPAAMFITARLMSIPIGTDPAYVALGPLTDCVILDERANPLHHDELKAPGLLDIRLSVLRTYNGRPGTYCEAVLISGAGSDYVFPQHARCMNKACEIAYQELQTQLGRTLAKQLKPDQVTGAVYITEGAAQEVEAFVNDPVASALKGQVTAVKFTLSRTDDLGSNQGATLGGTVAIEANAYFKGAVINAKFVRTISTGG